MGPASSGRIATGGEPDRVQPAPQEELVGTWTLVSCVGRWSDGRVMYRYGESPRGMLIYDAGGNFSGQIFRQDRPHFESGNLLKGAPAEIKDAFEGYIAYYGTYEVDEAAGSLTHHVKGSLFPNWIGEDQTRLYEFSDGKLTLTTLPLVGKRAQLTLTLVWERSG